MNVLVVDDEVKNAELVAAELRDAGFTTAHVAGGAAALIFCWTAPIRAKMIEWQAIAHRGAFAI